MTKLASTLAGMSALTLGLLALRCSGSDSGKPSVDAGGAQDAAGADAEGPDTSVGDAGGGGGDAAPDGPVGCTFDPGADGGLQRVGPLNQNIQYFGRVDLNTASGRPRFAASSVYIKAKFMGSAIDVRLFDEGRGGSFNILEAIVDQYPPVRLAAPDIQHEQTMHVFPVNVTDDGGAPVPLPCGVHTITVAKRTEADVGYTEFGGFDVAELLPPDPAPTRKIEIIGDSITCGSGIEAKERNAAECSQNGFVDSNDAGLSGYGQGVENGYLAYGSVLARTLNASWHVTCAGGIGLVRNYYSRGDQTPMPGVYPFLYPEDHTVTPTLWPTKEWSITGDAGPEETPDVVVIGLGTNDFSRDSAPAADGGTVLRDPMPVGNVADAGPDAASNAGTLEQGYVSFIDQLRAIYPGVHVILINSPLLGDNYPTQSDMQATQHTQAIQDVTAYYAGDPAVHVDFAVVPSVSGTGCGGHPSVAQQAGAAAAVAAKIKTVMSW